MLVKNTRKICINIAIAIFAVMGVLTMTAYAAEIHGTKWDDSNGNTIRDLGEAGVQGVTICYYSSSGSFPVYPGDCMTTTGPDGSYSLLGLANGSYEIYEIVPPGKVQTHPYACPMLSNCSLGPGWQEVTVAGSDIVYNIDFGNADASEIHGTKFNDSDGDGIKDPGESGIPNIGIILKRVIAPGNEKNYNYKRTDINGDYTFTNISAGYYKVEEDSPLGVSQTLPASGAPYYITVGAGEVKTGIDFGNTQVPPGTITGTSFNDSNGNGIQDTDEGGVEGVTILLSSSGIIGTTDIDGNYTFFNVPVGQQNLYENVPVGYVATTSTFVNVKVSSEETSVINFGIRKLTPPPSDVNIVQQTGTTGAGIPTLMRPGLTTLKIEKNLTWVVGTIAGVNLTLRWSDVDIKTADMEYNSTTGKWEAIFNLPFPPGTAEMTFKVDVNPPGIDFFEIGDIIFLDPSGQIRNSCDDKPIEGAEATLYLEFPPGSFIESPTGYQVPDINPQTTLADGYYRWDVIPFNTYKVVATKTGFVSNESAPVAVPPIRTGLDILLTPTGGCSNSYSFTGFFPPVENPSVLNKAKAGSAIPLKFSLGGYQGLDIFEIGYPKSSTIQCVGAVDTIGDNETATAGQSGLSYNQAIDQYSYVWKTDKKWTGCRQLVMKLDDGTYHRANFAFSK